VETGGNRLDRKGVRQDLGNKTDVPPRGERTAIGQTVRIQKRQGDDRGNRQGGRKSQEGEDRVEARDHGGVGHQERLQLGMLLARSGCPGDLGRAIADFLQDCSVTSEGVTVRTSRGCPQGSCLGPILWLLIMEERTAIGVIRTEQGEIVERKGLRLQDDYPTHMAEQRTPEWHWIC
jgi:hypothetical protein